MAAGVQDTADTVTRGTEAVNEALSEPDSPDPSDSPEKVAGLTELPDTGGAPPLAAGLGVLLASVRPAGAPDRGVVGNTVDRLPGPGSVHGRRDVACYVSYRRGIGRTVYEPFRPRSG